MQGRDRLINLAILAAAAAGWAAVWLILTTRDPGAAGTPTSEGFAGAAAIALAFALTCTPLMWLVVFARHRRIAYRGDWFRAARRGSWVGLVAGGYVVMRLLDFFSLPVALFVAALVLMAEVTLSIER